MSEILSRQEGNVLVLSFNRSEKMNALTRSMYAGLAKGLNDAAGDFGIRAVADSVYFSILESGPDVNEQFGVDAVEMAKRFKVLPLASQLAIIEVCRRFWVRKDINAKFTSYREILDSHGAKFSD
jgi:enoyl-CoA hydratase/carnithine racemase